MPIKSNNKYYLIKANGKYYDVINPYVRYIYDKNGVAYDPKTLTSITGTQFVNSYTKNKNIGYVLNFDLLTSIYVTGLSNALCYSNVKAAYFNSLTSISTNSCFRYCFRGSLIEILGFSALTSITGNSVFRSAVIETQHLKTVRFPVLSYLESYQCFYETFKDSAIEDIYFNALTTSSFGTQDEVFLNMLSGLTGVKVHFPSNLESTISSQAGYATDGTCFGGASGCYCVFDLSATI